MHKPHAREGAGEREAETAAGQRACEPTSTRTWPRTKAGNANTVLVALELSAHRPGPTPQQPPQRQPTCVKRRNKQQHRRLKQKQQLPTTTQRCDPTWVLSYLWGCCTSQYDQGASGRRSCTRKSCFAAQPRPCLIKRIREAREKRSQLAHESQHAWHCYKAAVHQQAHHRTCPVAA